MRFGTKLFSRCEPCVIFQFRKRSGPRSGTNPQAPFGFLADLFRRLFRQTVQFTKSNQPIKR